MTHLVERLAELRRHLEHLRHLRPRVRTPADLEDDLSLHNDVLFSLLTVCQLVIDVAGELCGAASLRFENYTEAVRKLGELLALPPGVVQELARLPGFRNVLVHEYAEVDFGRVIEALGNLSPVEALIEELSRRGDL